MVYFSLNMILTGGSVILALIGFYFVVRIWIKWRNIDMDVLKARVFLNKKFLEKNWWYVFLTGAALTAHQFLVFLMHVNYIINDYIGPISEALEFMALLFLVILAYEWHILIRTKKDKLPI